MSRELRKGDIAFEDVDEAIICGETQDPEGGLTLDAESIAVVESVLRCKSERLRVTMLWGFLEETPEEVRPCAVIRKGWLTSDSELVRLAREGRRGW